MQFLENLIKCDPHFFWSQVKNYNNQVSVYLGSLKINNEIEDYSDFITNLETDLQSKISNHHFYLKLFYDLDDNNLPLLHYLLIIEREHYKNFKKTLFYVFSKLNNIDHGLINYKKQIDHYLEYHDAYGYQRIDSFALGILSGAK